MSTSSDDPTTSGRWIYRPYVVKNGKRVYPKNGRVFRFWVDDEE